jgi:hypothetical protein
MDDTTSDTFDQADDDILTPTVSDEAIEAVVYGPRCAPTEGCPVPSNPGYPGCPPPQD